MNDPRPRRRPLAWFHDVRKGAMCWLAYLSMRLYGFRPDFDSIRNDAYDGKVHTDRDLDRAKDLDGLLALAKDCLKNAADRRAAVSDKCKTLLTLSSLLLGLVGALLPKQLAFEAAWMRVLVFLSVLTLLNTVALLLVFFGVGREMTYSLEQCDVDLEKDDLKKSLINTYLQCQISSDCRTDYLVDLYKTARFFFLTAFSVLVLLFSANFFMKSESDQAELLITELRADPRLIELLRGPKGDVGETGRAGRDGANGAKGERGEVDADAVARAIINDERFRTQLQKLSAPEAGPDRSKR